MLESAQLAEAAAVFPNHRILPVFRRGAGNDFADARPAEEVIVAILAPVPDSA